MAFDYDGAGREFPDCLFVRGTFHLSKIGARMGVFWVQQAIVELWLVCEKQKAFGVHIKSAERIDVFREAKFSESPLPGLIRGELAENVVWFVKGDDH